jgi:hypothetical protein
MAGLFQLPLVVLAQVTVLLSSHDLPLFSLALRLVDTVGCSVPRKNLLVVVRLSDWYEYKAK